MIINYTELGWQIITQRSHSRHIQFVQGDDQKAKAFISDLKKREDVWMKASCIGIGELNKGYELLEFCDTFFLLICQGLVPHEHPKIEIGKAPDGKAYEMWAEADVVIVSHWPFEILLSLLSWESKALPQYSFKSVSEFRTTIEKSQVVTHRFKLCDKE